MKRIILLHTVQCMYLTFEERLRKALNCEVKIDNLLDTFFASNSNELGGQFTQANIDRLYLTLKSAELTGCDCIAVICSTLSPYVKKIRPLIPVPVITIDERLGEEAIKYGDRIQILASAPSAVAATLNLIHEAEEKAGRTLQIETRHNLDAFHSMMSGDLTIHDQELRKMAAEVKDKDCIVFAQGSMEHMAEEVSKISGLPVITAPQLCIEQIKSVIEG